MAKETVDLELLKRLAKEHKAVSLSITDVYGNIEAEVYQAHVMYTPDGGVYVAYWDPSDCSKKHACGYKPSQIPEDKNSWKLNGRFGDALYRNLKVLDGYCLGGL